MGQPSINVMSSDNLERLPLEAQLDYLEVSIRRLLKRYPVATMERINRLILLSPVRDGFPIIISVSEGRRLVLEFGGWHEDEFSGLTILNLVDLALSGQLRLKDEFINGKASRHSVEISDGKSDWSLIGSISFFVLSVFRRRKYFRVRTYSALGSCGEAWAR